MTDKYYYFFLFDKFYFFLRKMFNLSSNFWNYLNSVKEKIIGINNDKEIVNKSTENNFVKLIENGFEENYSDKNSENSIESNENFNKIEFNNNKQYINEILDLKKKIDEFDIFYQTEKEKINLKEIEKIKSIQKNNNLTVTKDYFDDCFFSFNIINNILYNFDLLIKSNYKIIYILINNVPENLNKEIIIINYLLDNIKQNNLRIVKLKILKEKENINVFSTSLGIFQLHIDINYKNLLNSVLFLKSVSNFIEKNFDEYMNNITFIEDQNPLNPFILQEFENQNLFDYLYFSKIIQLSILKKKLLKEEKIKKQLIREPIITRSKIIKDTLPDLINSSNDPNKNPFIDIQYQKFDNSNLDPNLSLNLSSIENKNEKKRNSITLSPLSLSKKIKIKKKRNIFKKFFLK